MKHYHTILSMGLIGFSIGCGESTKEANIETDTVLADNDGDGFTVAQGDCNDNVASISPGNVEVCGDVIDNNCDGNIDEPEALDAYLFYKDGDGDGYGVADRFQKSCQTQLNGYVRENQNQRFDCDDENHLAYPAAAIHEPALCTIDEDGDGFGLSTDGLSPDTIVLYDGGSDCDDSNAEIFPGSARFEPSQSCVLDSDGDGFGDSQVANPFDIGQDCDDSNAEIFPGSARFEPSQSCVLDSDGDGFGDSQALEPYDAGQDCDDNETHSNPNAHEICGDGIDNNCDGTIDDDSDGFLWYFDADGDGVGSTLSLPIRSCSQPDNYSSLSTDCDDQNSSTYPNAPEYCNNIDDDCDGDIDEGENQTAPFGAPMWYGDSDEDGFFGGVPTIACSPPMGFSASVDDCNDENPNIHPSADETCNGIDDNCNNDIDDNPVSNNIFYRDQDGDGFGDPQHSVSECAIPDGFVNNSDDCDDMNTNISPDADEICNNIDDNCDQDIDNNPTDAPTWFRDVDEDGQGNIDNSKESCTQPTGFVNNADDCNDNDNTQHRLDLDGDGVGSCDGDCDDNDEHLNLTDYDNDGFSTCENDCNDFNPDRNPQVVETCDNIDNNCDGEIDENTSVDAKIWYIDEDGDGFGSETTALENTSATTTSCTQPEGFVDNADDCNNTDPLFSPVVTEICDGIDNDCDELIDDEDDSVDGSSGSVFYADLDEDGQGNLYHTISRCLLPDGFVENADDCDDGSPERFLGSNEYCNGLDDDCDKSIDEEDAIDRTVFFYDGDGDGHGIADVSLVISACPVLGEETEPPQNYSLLYDDCDDENADIAPSLPELCSPNIDEDCDGDPQNGAFDQSLWYIDADGDGFGNSDLAIATCSAPGGLSTEGEDCDDQDSEVYPTAPEICNGKLDDCNTAGILSFDPVLSRYLPSDEWDADLDGYVDCDFDIPMEMWQSSQAANLIGDGDCDDNLDFVYPSAEEQCNGQYDDCLMRSSSELSEPEDENDGDDDGYVECTSDQPHTWLGDSKYKDSVTGLVKGGDCNDSNPNIYTGVIDSFPDLCLQDIDGDGVADCALTGENYECDVGFFIEGTDIGFDFMRVIAGTDIEGLFKFTRDYLLMSTEVTQAMYEEVIGINPNASLNQEGDVAVTYISWNDAAVLANALSEIHQLQTCYECTFSNPSDLRSVTSCLPKEEFLGKGIYDCVGYRLPTESEWLYATRSNSKFPFWSDFGGGSYDYDYCNANVKINDGNDSVLGDYAWFCGNSGGSLKPVAQKLPNDFGIYDSIGNAIEHVHDRYQSTYPPQSEDPVFFDSSGSNTVLRGGSYSSSPYYLQYGYRTQYNKASRSSTIGLRLARSVFDSKPTVPHIAFSSLPTQALDDLVCTVAVHSVDPEENSISYEFSWKQNGSPYTGSTSTTTYSGDSIPQSELEVGQQWTCMVTASDGLNDSPMASTKTTIEDNDLSYTLYMKGENIDFELVQAGDDPLERYTLEHNIYVQSTEVTQNLFYQIFHQTPSSFRDCGMDCPVEKVSWNHAVRFAIEMSERAGLESCYECIYSNELDPMSGFCSVKEDFVGENLYACSGYRLPTEAEFEYISRSGTTQAIWSPDGGGFYLRNSCDDTVVLSDSSSTLLQDMAIFCGNSNQSTAMVAQFPANDFGIFDTIGNVSEWMHDNDISFPSSQSNPVGSSTGMVRGGNWYSYPSELSHGTRTPFTTTSLSNQVGFRLVRIAE